MKAGSDLPRRLLTAAVALPALVAAIFYGPPLLTVGIAALATGIGLAEYFALVVAAGHRPHRLAGMLVAAGVFFQVVWPGRVTAPLWPLAAAIALVSALPRAADKAAAIAGASLTALGALYLGGLGGAVAALRVLPPPDEGAWRVVFLLAAVMVSDSAAYFVGSALGRRKLAPAISPGKTVEGALGGLLGGAAGALVVRQLGLPALPLGHAVGLGLSVAALGVAGDLAESLLKRWAGVKDSGALFPGHGGMLDRLDSILFGAVAVYYYFLYAGGR